MAAAHWEAVGQLSGRACSALIATTGPNQLLG